MVVYYKKVIYMYKGMYFMQSGLQYMKLLLICMLLMVVMSEEVTMGIIPDVVSFYGAVGQINEEYSVVSKFIYPKKTKSKFQSSVNPNYFIELAKQIKSSGVGLKQLIVDTLDNAVPQSKNIKQTENQLAAIPPVLAQSDNHWVAADQWQFQQTNLQVDFQKQLEDQRKQKLIINKDVNTNKLNTLRHERDSSRNRPNIDQLMMEESMRNQAMKNKLQDHTQLKQKRIDDFIRQRPKPIPISQSPFTYIQTDHLTSQQTVKSTPSIQTVSVSTQPISWNALMLLIIIVISLIVLIVLINRVNGIDLWSFWKVREGKQNISQPVNSEEQQAMEQTIQGRDTDLDDQKKEVY